MRARVQEREYGDEHPASPLRLIVPLAVVLGVVLLALIPVFGSEGTFSSDEGATIIQARALAEDGSWFLEHPFPEADPDGDAFPLEKSARTDEGFAPLPKQPVYSLLQAGAYRLGGVSGLLVLSVVAVVAAASVVGWVSEQVRPGTGAAALLLTGVASPLFVDSFLVYAHTLSAAMIAGCLACVHVAQQRRGVAVAILAPVFALSASLVRNEAVLAAAALGFVTVLFASKARDRRLSLIGGAVLAAGVGGFVLERFLQAWIFGGGITDRASAPAGSPLTGRAGAGGGPADFLGDRVEAFVTTWLRPTYDPDASAVAALAVLLFGVLLVVALRRRPIDRSMATVMAIAVVACAVARPVLRTEGLLVVPGLLVAFPALAWGLASMDRTSVRNRSVAVGVASFAVFSLLVIASQYRQGGSMEWGGRYFAAGLPLVLPGVAVAFHRQISTAPDVVARLALVAVVVGSVSSAFVGLHAVKDVHEKSDVLVASVISVADRTDPGDGGVPVIVTTQPELPRSTWSSLDDHRWLLVAPDEVADQLWLLENLGVSEVALATRAGDEVSRELARTTYEPDLPLPRESRDLWWITAVRT